MRFSYSKKKNIPQIKQISAERKNIKFAKSAGGKNKDGTCSQLARLQRLSYGKRKNIPQIAWIYSEELIIGLRKSAKSAGGNK